MNNLNNIVKLLLLSVVIFAFTNCSSSGASRRRTAYSRGHARRRTVPRNYDYRKNYKVNKSRLVSAIDPWIGTPYCIGGDTRKCIDCSGFVKNIFKKVTGAKLPRTAEEQYKLGKSVGRNHLIPGDLVFFKTGRKRISHVGIYIGNEQFAHAGTKTGVTITKMNKPYFKNRYIGARRLF